MEARQGQDARLPGGLIHDSRAPRAALIQALFVQRKLRGGGEAMVQSLAHLIVKARIGRRTWLNVNCSFFRRFPRHSEALYRP